MIKKDIFERAKILLTESRATTYGDAYAMHQTIAKVWSALLGHHFEPETVALMMAALKLCRESKCKQSDNIEDAIAYLGVYDQILSKKTQCVE
jgi:hypothetical protein